MIPLVRCLLSLFLFVSGRERTKTDRLALAMGEVVQRVGRSFFISPSSESAAERQRLLFAGKRGCNSFRQLVIIAEEEAERRAAMEDS